MKSFDEINTILGDNADNIKDLCQSSYINKWSFYKPINSSKIDIYDADIYADNDGFNLHYWSTWYDCMNNQSYDWSYKNREAPFRLGDFNGYSHYAVPWFALDLAQGSTVYIGSSANIFIENDVQNFVNMFKVFEGTGNNIDYCYIIYDLSSTTKYLYKFCNVQDLANYNSLYISIDNNFISGHNYKAVPILTTATVSWADRTKDNLRQDSSFPGASWWSFPPESYVTFTVDDRPAPPTPTQYITVDVDNMIYSWNDPVIADMTFDVIMSLGGNMTGDVVISVDVWYDPIQNEITPQSVKLNNYTVIGTLNINGVSTRTFNCSHRDDIYVTIAGNLEDRIPVRIVYSYTYNGNTYGPITIRKNVERANA